MMDGKNVSPRGMLTRELEHYSICIEDPYDITCTGMNSNWSAKVAGVEAIQLIGGFSSPKLVERVSPRLMNFARDDGTFDGAYGTRTSMELPAVVQRLIDDPSTRQAVIPIWRPEDVHLPTSRDYPCTLTIAFMLRDGRLNAHVTMRSNDVNWGFKHDMFQFTQLQLTVANVLGVPAGVYYHTAYSMHLYESSFSWAWDLEEPFLGHSAHPRGFSGETIDAAMRRAAAIALREPEKPQDDSERWYKETLYGTVR